MTVSISVQVRSNKFPQAPALLRAAVGRAFAQAAPGVLADMQRRTPVDTGELRGSETVTATDDTLTLYAGTDHAVFVHQGARGRAPRPFMTDAIDAATPGLIDAIVAEADRGLA